MSNKTKLELLNDNLNKHMEICALNRKVKKLKIENERLHGVVSVLADEVATANKKLDWLRQAEHLVIWDGSQWRVCHEHGGKQL